MSSPSAPVKTARLGPTFAVINDVDRQIEEELGLDPVVTEDKKHVDDEIDELLSEGDEDLGAESNANTGVKATGPTSKEPKSWTCKWDDCWKDWPTQDGLVDHVQGDHIGIGRENYICFWDACPRKGQKQATRHSLITHCRAHTGERPYSCAEAGCNKTFTRSDALTKHLRSLHGITPEVPPSKKKGKDAASALTSQPLAGGSSPLPPSAVGSSPIAFKRSEVDEVIADALLSPTEPSIAIAAPAPAVPAPLPEIAPAAPSGSSSKAPRARKPSRKDRKPANAVPSASTIALPSLPIPNHSAFLHPDIEDLSTDVDLGSVLPKLCGRDIFWTESDDDEPALELVRERRSKLRRTPPPYADEIDYDSLDEEIPAIGSPRIVAETTLTEDPTTALPVMSRTKWQARYMMSKAKVMLLSEENEMRRRELEKTLMEEMELDQQL